MPNNRLAFSLFLLRLGVGIVMIAWSIDKIMNPDHAAKVFSHFYLISGLGSMTFKILGGLQLAVILTFIAGIAKTWSYGAVLIIHCISTLASWQQYLDGNLLFFAAWPMLAACAALFILREEDRMLTLGSGLITATR